MGLELKKNLLFRKAQTHGTGVSAVAKPKPVPKTNQGPADSFHSTEDVSSALGKKAKSLRKNLLTSRLNAVKSGVLSTVLGVTAVAIGGPAAAVLGVAAAGAAVLAAKVGSTARKERGELNQVLRQRVQLWSEGPDTQLSTQHANGPIAMLDTQNSEITSQKKLTFDEKYGPWAVVTGASSGIGKEFAKQLAAKGIRPVLVARNGEKLKAAAKEIREEFGVEVRTVTADLSKAEDVTKIDSETRDLNVGLLVNNAGVWAEGEFLGNDVEKEAMVNRVNMEAPMRLSSAFGKRLSARGAGGILNVGSALAHVPTAYQANYAATKAYLNHFSKALSFEMAPQGVDVMVLNPGATKTEGTAHIDQSKMPIKPMSPEDVVGRALRGLGKTNEVIPGFQNKLAFGVGLRMLPQQLSVALIGSEAAKFMGIDR